MLTVLVVAVTGACSLLVLIVPKGPVAWAAEQLGTHLALPAFGIVVRRLVRWVVFAWFAGLLQVGLSSRVACLSVATDADSNACARSAERLAVSLAHDWMVVLLLLLTTIVIGGLAATWAVTALVELDRKRLATALFVFLGGTLAALIVVISHDGFLTGPDSTGWFKGDQGATLMVIWTLLTLAVWSLVRLLVRTSNAGDGSRLRTASRARVAPAGGTTSAHRKPRH